MLKAAQQHDSVDVEIQSPVSHVIYHLLSIQQEEMVHLLRMYRNQSPGDVVSGLKLIKISVEQKSIICIYLPVFHIALNLDNLLVLIFHT